MPINAGFLHYVVVLAKGPNSQRGANPQLLLTRIPRSVDVKKAFEILQGVAIIALFAMGMYNFVRPPQRPTQARPELTPPKDVVSLEGAQIKGDPNAPITVVVYSDFECPFCGRFATEIMPDLDKDYIETGKVKLAFRNVPLDNVHKQAVAAAIYTVCAGEQGKFWPAHDDIFKDQSVLKSDWKTGFAKKHELNGAKFETCVQSPETKQRIKAEKDIATKYNITGTPAMFVGKSVEGGVHVEVAISGADKDKLFQSVSNLLK